MDKSIIHKLVLFLAAICSTFSVSAYDFEVDGIYYDKISDTSVEVTYNGCWYDNNGAGYSGNVTIPETIEIDGITYFVCGIGQYAFYGTAGMTSFTIPASVTSISVDAFRSCTDLTEIVINGNNPNYASSNGVLFNKTYTELILCPTGKAGMYNIPEGITSIGDNAFFDCTGLTSVTIPEGVISIGHFVFAGCTGLTSVTIPEGVTSIGHLAFRGCTNLTSVTFPASVTSIDHYNFLGCTGLTKIIINENNPKYASSDGVLFNKTYTELILCPAGKAGIYSIPDGVTSIGNDAFEGCTDLTSVSIPASVTSIGNSAFWDCSGLTSVNIPEGVTSIDESTFKGCSSLTSVTIPEGLTSIGGDAFRDCTSLTSVSIPEGLTSIGHFAFTGSTSLTSVTIPASVTYIGLSVFDLCSALTEIIINENNPNYASNDGVLFNKTYTELITWPAGKAGIYSIPEGVTSIGYSAFESCTGLTSVIIPESVTSIGDHAFHSCKALNRVIFFAETVPTFGYKVFAEVPTECSIYVPSGTRDSYATANKLAPYTIKEFGVNVTPAEVTLKVGATAELTASYTVDGAAETETEISSVLGSEFIWSSSAENVAAVSTSGQVTARNTGTAEIMATTRFGNTVFATSTVNVGTSGILDVSADGIRISATSGKIIVENIGENQKVSAYTIDGIGQILKVSKDGTVEIPAETGRIYIIVVDGFATKVLAK